MKRLFVICVLFFSGCAFPPDEATQIQKHLQTQISSGQVYLNHSSDELSFVIRNSEYTKLPDEDKAKLVGDVEDKMLELLSKNRDFKEVKIYFLGDSAAGVKMPYICNLTVNACTKNQ